MHYLDDVDVHLITWTVMSPENDSCFGKHQIKSSNAAG